MSFQEKMRLFSERLAKISGQAKHASLVGERDKADRLNGGAERLVEFRAFLERRKLVEITRG